MLQGNGWTLDNVSFMLRLHENFNIRIQNLDGCLHLVLGGTWLKTLIKVDALILLIKAGADVYAENRHGFTVSEYACMSPKQFKDAPKDYLLGYPFPLSPDVSGARGDWLKALTACGYDADEVISRSVRVDKISEVDSDDDDESDDNDDMNTFSSNDESDDNDDEAGGVQLYQNTE